MAEQELEMTFKWENDESFEVIIQEDGEPKTLVKMDENGDIASLWSSVSDLLERYIKSLMTRIGKDMQE